MNEPLFLTLAEILDLHEQQLEVFGGSAGIRDLGLLESAMMVPQATSTGVFLHDSLQDMAAAYAFHIAQNQPFLDGNKRTALAAALVFLELNEIDVEDPKRMLYEAMIKIAEHRMTKKEFGQLLKKLSQPSE